MCNYYDEDDYEVASPSTIDEGEFFGDIEEEQDFDLMVELLLMTDFEKEI